VGHTAYNRGDFFFLKRYVQLLGRQWVKQLMPDLRDAVVFSFAWASDEDRRTGVVPADSPAAPPNGLSEHPFVSVVLPTHNRAGMLRDAWAGLLAQTYPRDRFEVVLINDNSADDTDEVAQELIVAPPFKVRYIKTEGLGATGARNLGMREATGEIVAHLDDDCRPAAEWMEEGVRGFAEGVAIVGGAVVPKPEQGVPFFSHAIVYEEDLGTYPTANLFLRRDVALETGGFDESFGRNILGRPVWGWDSDLAWRIRRRGYRARFRRAALTYMEVFPLTPKAWLLEGWRSVVLPTLVRRIPELGRHILLNRVFAHQGTLLFDLALVGAVLAVVKRRRWPLLAVGYWALWWASHIAKQDMWPPQRWPRLGIKLSLLALRQAVMLAALLVGSYRARRPVL
jgi:glycosyltransferase involved in cell wall biosynthesis